MSSQRFESGKAPYIEVKQCRGNLVVRTWNEPTVKADGTFIGKETEPGLVFSAEGDLIMTVPRAATLSIGEVGGDAVLKNGAGPLHVQTVRGDLVLQNSAEVKVEAVFGDIAARNLSGSLAVEEVKGDIAARNIEGSLVCTNVFGSVSARNVTGSVSLHEVMGDVALATVNGDIDLATGQRDANFKNIGGEIRAEHVMGDIRLRGGLSSGDHFLNAKGDIVVRWPLSAPVSLVANSASIKNNLRLEDLVEKEGQLIGRVGDGKTNLTLNANGRIHLKDAQMIDPKWSNGEDEPDFNMNFEFDLADLGARISNEINDKVSRFTQEFETRFGADFGQTMADEAAKRAEQAATRAEQAAKRMRPTPPPPPPPPPAPKTPVSAEEQLKILKMVEQGKISPAEAEVLLDALNG